MVVRIMGLRLEVQNLEQNHGYDPAKEGLVIIVSFTQGDNEQTQNTEQKNKERGVVEENSSETEIREIQKQLIKYWDRLPFSK